MEKLPDNLVLSLGNVAVAAARLDFALIFAIGRLTFGLDELNTKYLKLTLALVGGEGFEVLLAKLEKLISLRQNSKIHLKELNDFHLRDLNELRNRYLHPYWIMIADKPTFWKIGKAMPPTVAANNLKSASPQEVDELSKKIKTAVDQMADFTTHLLESGEIEDEKTQTKG